MSSEELMNRGWQYDIVGLIMFVLANTSNTDFGKVMFTIFGVVMIVGSLVAMLMAYKRSIREEQARERMVKEIIETIIEKEVPTKRQKRTRSVKKVKTIKDTSKKQNKA